MLKKQWNQVTVISYVLCVFACATYFWFPTLTPVGEIKSFHEMQADAFLSGQLQLSIEPKPEVKAASNPYDRNLEDFWYWDAVYYEGHYYSYFGPFPALLIALGKMLGASFANPDMVITIVFTCLRLVFGAGVLHQLWQHCRPNAPASVLVMSLMSLAWCNPVPFLLGRAQFYEVAIVCAQAMFLAGLYCDMRASESGGASSGWACLSGIAYGACVASRASLLPAVLIVSVAAILIRAGLPKAARIKHAVAMWTPLICTALLLGAMNYFRFGDPFESGQRYMFTVEMPSPSFQLQYVFGNIYNYFFRPLIFVDHFPYLSITDFTAWPFVWPCPNGTYLEPMVGLVLTTPIFVIALASLPVVRSTLYGLIRSAGRQRREAAYQSNDAAYATFVVGAAALTVGALLPLLFYYAATMRYAADFVAGVALLFAIGLIDGLQRCSEFSLRRRLVTVVAIGFTTYTILAGITACVQLPHH